MLQKHKRTIARLKRRYEDKLATLRSTMARQVTPAHTHTRTHTYAHVQVLPPSLTYASSHTHTHIHTHTIYTRVHTQQQHLQNKQAHSDLSRNRQSMEKELIKGKRSVRKVLRKHQKAFCISYVVVVMCVCVCVCVILLL